MRLFQWLLPLSRRTELAPPRPTPPLIQAVAVLQKVGVAAGGVLDVDRWAVSSNARYCALTLKNYESYAVDLHACAYLHWPNAGVVGFSGCSVELSPDEERFSLEPSGHESFEIDLSSDQIRWLPTST